MIRRLDSASFFWGFVTGVLTLAGSVVLLTVIATAKEDRATLLERRTQLLEGLPHGKSLRDMTALSLSPRYCSSCHTKPPLTGGGGTGGGTPPQVIPLPATALLFGAGLAGITMMKKKRNR